MTRYLLIVPIFALGACSTPVAMYSGPGGEASETTERTHNAPGGLGIVSITLDPNQDGTPGAVGGPGIMGLTVSR